MHNWKAGDVFHPCWGWGEGSLDPPAAPEVGGTWERGALGWGAKGADSGDGGLRVQRNLPPSSNWAAQGAGCSLLAKILAAEAAERGWTCCSQRAKGLLGFSQNRRRKYCYIAKPCYSHAEQEVMSLKTRHRSHQSHIPGFLPPRQAPSMRRAIIFLQSKTLPLCILARVEDGVNHFGWYGLWPEPKVEIVLVFKCSYFSGLACLCVFWIMSGKMDQRPRSSEIS